MRCLAAIALALSSTALAAPVELTHQGRLLDATGAPLDGAHDLTVLLYSEPAGGSVLWSETRTAELDGGYYALILGEDASGNPLDTSLFEAHEPGTIYLALAIDDGPELPVRQPLTTVPYAAVAQHATNATNAQHATSATALDGGAVDATSISVNGTTIVDASGVFVGPMADQTLASLSCADGQIAAWSDAASAWGCADDLDEVLGASEVTAIVTSGPLDLAPGTTMGGEPLLTGVSWGDITGKPTGFDDDTDDVLTKEQVRAYVTTGHLDVAGTVTDERVWYRTYKVSTSNATPLLDKDGSPIPNNWTGLVFCGVTGTNAPGTAQWMVRRRSDNAVHLERIASFGSLGSNTPEIFNDGGVVKLRLYTHGSEYNVRCRTERLIP